ARRPASAYPYRDRGGAGRQSRLLDGACHGRAVLGRPRTRRAFSRRRGFEGLNREITSCLTSLLPHGRRSAASLRRSPTTPTKCCSATSGSVPACRRAIAASSPSPAWWH